VSGWAKNILILKGKTQWAKATKRPEKAKYVAAASASAEDRISNPHPPRKKPHKQYITTEPLTCGIAGADQRFLLTIE